MNIHTDAEPVTIIAIGAGNRTNKYLEYAVRHPERLKLAGVVEINEIRRRTTAEKLGLGPERCFTDHELCFKNPIPAETVLIAPP